MKNILWEKEPLGLVPDRELALKLGVSESKVGIIRRKFQIETFKEKNNIRSHIDWDLQPLGQISDNKLGKQLGVSYNIVGAEIKKRNIPSFRSTFEINWGQTKIGKVEDALLAAELGIPAKKVTQARLQKNIPNIKETKHINWEVQPLGKMSDQALATLLGVDRATVQQARVKREIPSCTLICLTQEKEHVNYPEAVIDLFWHKTNTPHKAQVTIKPYRVDWLLGDNKVVEFAGFSEHRKLGAQYMEKLQKKKINLEKRGYEVQIIMPSELHNFNTGEMPIFVENHICRICGKPDKNATRSLCGKHYKKWLILSHAQLELDQRLKKLRKPVFNIYKSLQEIGKSGEIDFSRKPVLLKGISKEKETTCKKSTLKTLVSYNLIVYRLSEDGKKAYYTLSE
jgi:hypothetical protein